VATTEIRGAPIHRSGRVYVPVARRTEIRLSFGGTGIFARYDRPVRIDVPGAAPARIVDWDLALRAALTIVAAALLTRRMRR
jgi:hypothetical protein